MIRQAINCDICAAEKQASNYWFVAYEQAGELKVRGWEPTKSARKNAMHLCGQKCAQRMMANFMTSLMANSHGSEQSKDAPSEVVDAAAGNDGMQVAELSERLDRSHRVSRTGPVAGRWRREGFGLVGRARTSEGRCVGDAEQTAERARELSEYDACEDSGNESHTPDGLIADGSDAAGSGFGTAAALYPVVGESGCR